MVRASGRSADAFSTAGAFAGVWATAVEARTSTSATRATVVITAAAPRPHALWTARADSVGHPGRFSVGADRLLDALLELRIFADAVRTDAPTSRPLVRPAAAAFAPRPDRSAAAPRGNTAPDGITTGVASGRPGTHA
jgi:hypothetical protein